MPDVKGQRMSSKCTGNDAKSKIYNLPYRAQHERYKYCKEIVTARQRAKVFIMSICNVYKPQR